jgi:hypothetical protein
MNGIGFWKNKKKKLSKPTGATAPLLRIIMTLTVRNLKPGQQFMLKRTGEWFIFIEKQLDTPSGMRHVVTHDDPFNLQKRNGRRITLHHSCHVIAK